MIFSIPLNTRKCVSYGKLYIADIVVVMARVMKKMQQKQMKNRDRRTRLMSELLANIKR
jgi:ATP-binding cassette, subfamily C (CFTR/MRP), member 1